MRTDLRIDLKRELTWVTIQGGGQSQRQNDFQDTPIPEFSKSILWTKCLCYLVDKSDLTLLQCHRLQSSRLLCPWNFPGKNTGVGCYFLLQGIFLTQGLNLCLLHCRWILYCFTKGKPLNICVSPPNSCLSPKPKVMVLDLGPLGGD